MTIRRRDKYRVETYLDINKAARIQMARYGTAGITLRGIARELGMSAPALYHYYPNLEALITSLVIDAFEGLAAEMQKASIASNSIAGRLKSTMMAYRSWALAHPVDFQLIYGNPIPGYSAPAAVTAPLARRPFETLASLVHAGWRANEFHVPDELTVLPESIDRHLAGFRQSIGTDLPTGLMYFLVESWSRGHGMVMLELFEHSTPVLGDAAAFYEFEVDRIIHSLQAS